MNADDTTEYVPLPEGCEAIPDPRFGAFCYCRKTYIIETRKNQVSPEDVLYFPERHDRETVSQAVKLRAIFNDSSFITLFDPDKLKSTEEQP